VEEEEKKVIRGGKWGLRLLGVGVWSRLAGTEGVRCRRKERLARSSIRHQEWLYHCLWEKLMLLKKRNLKSHKKCGFPKYKNNFSSMPVTNGQRTSE
jgi:hypothetical protein